MDFKELEDYIKYNIQRRGDFTQSELEALAVLSNAITTRCILSETVEDLHEDVEDLHEDDKEFIIEQPWCDIYKLKETSTLWHNWEAAQDYIIRVDNEVWRVALHVIRDEMNTILKGIEDELGY